jgi:voltage-gated potassium channel
MSAGINRLRKRVFEIIERGKPGDRASRCFDLFLVSLISLNIAAIILESVQPIYSVFRQGFRAFEIFSVVVFTIEYLLRLWTADQKIRSQKGFLARLRYIFTPMALIDLMAILPFYLPFIVRVDLRFLRILRLTRLLRLLKIQRYSNSLSLIGRVLRQKKEELLVTVFVTTLLLVFSATLMYYIETDVQPGEFPNIVSAFWWAIATLTTIGYGDVYPITGWGRFLSGIIALLGIGLVALPAGILSSGFVEALRIQKEQGDDSRSEEEMKYCPYCGKKLGQPWSR